MDDLQTLCTATLRRCYAAGSDDYDTRSQTDFSSCAAVIASPSSSSSSSSTELATPIDPRAVKAFFEALDMEDNPRLQVESASVLTVIVDRLDPHEQQTVKDTAIPLLIDLIIAVDNEASARAEAVVERLLQGDGGGEILRNYDLEPMVDAVMGNDDGRAFTHVRLLSRIFCFYEVDYNDFVQRIADTGAITRFVEFLRRDDHTGLQEEAMEVLTHAVHSGDPDLTRAVVDTSHGTFVANVVRLLGHPNLDMSVKESAATWIIGVADQAPAHRDLVLLGGAVPPLVDMVQSQDPHAFASAARALCILCQGDPPPPNVEILRPAIPAVARLIGSVDKENAMEACLALGWLVDENDEMVVQSVVGAGPDACRRLVEFLLHPQLGWFALDIVANIVTSDDQALRAILDHNPLPALLTLLSSPDHPFRRRSCWVILNLAWDDQDRIQQIIDANIVPTLLRCLADENGGVRRYAAMAMGAHLTAHGSQRQVQVLVEAGCLPLLLDLLSNPGGEDDDESNDTVRDALEGIHNILIVGGFGGGSADPNLMADMRNAPIVAPDLMAEAQNVLSADGNGGSLRPNAMAERISSIPGGWSKIWALIPHQDDEIRIRAVRVLTVYYVPAQMRAIPGIPDPVPLEAIAGIIVPVPLEVIATSLVPARVGGTARGRRRTRSAPDAEDAAEIPPPPPRQRRRRQP